MKPSSVSIVLVLAAVSVAQPQTNGSPSTTAPPTSSITPSASTSTSTDVPLSLWGVAESLISSVYPSSSITNVASLTWPSAVVIGSSTYSVTQSTSSPSASLTGTSPASSASSAPLTGNSPASSASSPPKAVDPHRTLAIVVSVVVGAVVILGAAVIVCCLHRRKKHRTGGFFRQSNGTSVTDSEIGEWRTPSSSMVRTDSTYPYSQPRPFPHNYNHLAAPALPIPIHPTIARTHASESNSADNPFFTPAERATELQLAHAELAPEGSTPPHSSHRREMSPDWQPTPVSPEMMMAGAGRRHRTDDDAVRPDRASYERGRPVNPFASDEDFEANEAHDHVPPFIPTKSPERRHSPMVHYPSWCEVSEFDFAGEGRPGRRSHGDSLENASSRSSPSMQGYVKRESVMGRHELN